MMCYLVSGVPHRWQFSSYACISFRMNNVSLDPSQPILSLKMYLISFILCLLSLIYSYVLILYLSWPRVQKSFSVGNSFCICVLSRAFLTISLLMFILTNFYHLLKSLSHYSLINSNSVTFT